MSENSSKLDRKLTAEILVQFVFWSHSEVPDTELKKKKTVLKQNQPRFVGLNCLGRKKKKNTLQENLRRGLQITSLSLHNRLRAEK